MAECLGCHTVITSTHRHDYVSCKCGALAVDGGWDYARRVMAPGAHWRDLSLYRPCSDEECPDRNLEAAHWLEETRVQV